MFDIIQEAAPSSSEKNVSLVDEMRQGNTQSQTEYILGNLSLVASLSKKFVQQSPQYEYLIDDLFSEGMKALVKISLKIGSSCAIRQPQAYMVKSIFNAFVDLVRKERRDFEEPLTDEICHSLFTEPTREVDLKTDLETLASPQPEMIHLKYANYSYEEIAHQMGCSRNDVMRKLQSIKEQLELKYAY